MLLHCFSHRVGEGRIWRRDILEKVAKLGARQGPEDLNILLPGRKVIAGDDQPSNDLDGEEAVLNTLQGTALVIASVAEEGLPVVHLVDVDGAENIENLGRGTLQALPCP